VSAPRVDLRGVCKAFAGVAALQGVDFELRAGEVHALMGENGAGKSTLMKILAGVYARDAGELWVDGRPVDIESPRHAQTLGIGIVHQELNLMNHLSAAQNIFIGREPRGRFGLLLDEDRLNAQAAALFERLHLRLDPRARVGELSVARQQMVEIAKALSFDSRVLIMDEPTAALNPEEVAELFRTVRRLKEQGVGMVYISHKMDELRQIADRVTVMRDGRTVGTRRMADTHVDEIIAMMVGRELGALPRAPADAPRGAVALQVRGLTRLSGSRPVHDVSFTLHRGEILGFAGLMGAGRTEVARAVFGADPVDGGEIHVHGQRVHVRSPRDAVAAGIGYLSEDRKHFGLATSLDLRSNVVLASLARLTRLGFVDEHAVDAAATRSVQQLDIRTPSITQTVRLLSGGNQQKIVIAKWLLRDCDILIFDEPTRGIDVGAKAEIYRLLHALAEQGKALIVISSELPELLRLAHRIVVMCEGRITGELAAAEATQEAIMQLATRRVAATLH
jgi:ribose transport system ATP-binding protein